MENILKALAMFDWIGPALATVNIARGDVILWVPRTAGVNGGKIVKLLKAHGITVRFGGRMVVNNHLSMCIPKRHIEQAREILERAGYLRGV